MSININKHIEVFSELGKILRNYIREGNSNPSVKNKVYRKLDEAVKKTEIENPWFTRKFQLTNLEAWSEVLTEEKLISWLAKYTKNHEISYRNKKRVGLVLAGNIPLVGFHDILCVLLSGHYAVTRLSSKDRLMYPALKELMREIDPNIDKEWTIIEEGKLQDIDAIIATGSNNSARYFEYYFGKYPNIIRKNRNSIAILSGEETPEQIRALADDIFLYFGLGCRSVSKLFVPLSFKPEHFYPFIEDYAHLYQHSKYANNYDYQKAVHLVNKVPIFDNGFLILKEEKSLSSPVACLNYESYNDHYHLEKRLKEESDNIQCVITEMDRISEGVAFGHSQFPSLSDYADNIDTLKFLFNLYQN